MEKRTTVTLGSTGITVPKNGFGALPIQRISSADAVYLLHKAYDAGFRFFDTARFYTDSEAKIGEAFGSFSVDENYSRENIFIATKTMATTPEGFWQDLRLSLANLQCSYVDIYQFHNPAFCPLPGDGTGLYEAMLEAKAAGMIRHIGITNHRLSVARQAIESGCYETLQFPFSYLSGEQELALVKSCKEHNMGFIAMKSLAGGLINNAAAAYAYSLQFSNLLPIWGIQRESELDQFIAFFVREPELTPELQQVIEKDRAELAGEFCRGCGYCMPCPVGIKINDCARMSLMIRRAPSNLQLTEEMQAQMRKIEECLHCGKCASRCPYGLDTPALLQRNWEDYQNILNGKTII